MSDKLTDFPFAPEAEDGVLACMLHGGPAVIEACAVQLTGHHFHGFCRGFLFDCIVNLARCGKPVDEITLTSALRDAELLERLGGLQQTAILLNDIGRACPVPSHYSHYAEIVIDKFVRRGMIAAALEADRLARDGGMDYRTCLETSTSAFLELGQHQNDANSLRHIADDLKSALVQMEDRYHHRGRLDGMPTGFIDLDRMLDGLKGGNLYVIAGRPAMGKSAFAMAVALRMVREKIGVAYFTPELTRQQFAKRLFASEAEVTAEKIRRGFLSEGDFGRLHNAATTYCGCPLFLDDTGGLSIAKASAQLRRAVIQHGCKIGIFDYVQLMRGISKQAQNNKPLEMGEIMTGLKESAKQLGIPIIVLSQLSRAAEDRPDARPTMADLKESGAIEERAQFVGALYRPAYYAPESKPEKRKQLADKFKFVPSDDDEFDREFDQFAILDVLKHTDGATGEVKLKFIGEFTRYEDTAEAKARPLYSNNTAKQQQHE